MVLTPSSAPARLVYADCPWQMDDSLPGDTRGASKRYTTLSTEDLCRLVLPPIADRAILAFWKLASMPRDALDVIDAWGFEPKAEIVWRKTGRCLARGCGYDVSSQSPAARGCCPWCGAELSRWFAMGRYTRGEHETMIIATRGKNPSELVLSKSVRSTFEAPADKSEDGHSRKPEAARSILEQLFGGPRVELFGRRGVTGWEVYGDEVGAPLALGPLQRGGKTLLPGMR